MATIFTGQLPTTEDHSEAAVTPPGNVTTTITIIAPSNTQTPTEGVESAESAILPPVLGVVVTVTILTAALVTLLVAIAIIRRKTPNSSYGTAGPDQLYMSLEENQTPTHSDQQTVEEYHKTLLDACINPHTTLP